jgi:hypothetical protein
VAERLGDDPEDDAAIDAVLAVGVAKLVQGEADAEMPACPAGHDAVDHEVAETLAAAVLLAEERGIGCCIVSRWQPEGVRSPVAGTMDRLLEEALRLSADQRAELASELLATLEPDTPSERRTEAEWIEEIERRARSAVAGSPGVSWAEARAQIQNRLPSR